MKSVPRLTVKGQVGGHAGYHMFLNEMVQWLSRLGYYVSVRPSNVSESFGTSIPVEVKSRFVQRIQPEDWELVMEPPETVLTPGKKSAFFTMWEATRLRPAGVIGLKQAHAIITPSKWGASCFSAAGFDVPIYVVPLGVNPDIFNYAPMKVDGPCIFGAGGRMAHGGSRKGINEVIEAFQKAFPSIQNVRLKIKCFTDCNVEKPDDSRIEIVTDFLSEPGLANFLKGLTCFVTAARGEGWGLLQHQAMACGRPVLGCHYGGLAEFMNDHNSYGLAYTHGAATGFYDGCGTWSEPDLDDLVNKMQFVYQNREDVLKKGMQAYMDVRKLTWENTARKTIEVLKKVGAL